MDNSDNSQGPNSNASLGSTLQHFCTMKIVEERLKFAFTFGSVEDSLYFNGNPFFCPEPAAAAENSGDGSRNQQINNGVVLPQQSLSPPGDWNTVDEITEKGRDFFQTFASPSNPNTKLFIFDRIMDDLFQVMTDKYERILFQNLIENEDQKNLQIIVDELKFPLKRIFNISTNQYGVHSMKSLIKVLNKSPLINEIVKALSRNFLDLMIDQTGQDVILQCLEILDSQKLDPLYTEAIKKFLKLATHEWGCISLNRLIDRINGPPRAQVLSLIYDHAVFLAQDPYGTFVAQHCVTEIQDPLINAYICFRLKGHFVKLSMQKRGSHLVEKCLKSSGMDYVIDEFVNSKVLYQVAKDQFGNYVVQTLLEETKRRGSPSFETLVWELKKYVKQLQHGCGRNILKFIQSKGE